MPKPLNVLILEDNPTDAELLLIELRQSGFEPVWHLVDNEKDFTAYLKPELDLILSDYSLPQFSGLQALRLRNESGYDIPFVIVSGAISEDLAVECMREGASDYLFKDRLERLGMAADNAIKEKRLRDQKQQAEQMLQENEEYLKTIFETTSVATIVIEEDTTLSMVNKEFEILSGYSKEELEGKKSWTEFVAAEDLKRMQEFHRQRRIDPEKTLKYYEFHFINREGSLRDVLLRVDLIPGTKISVASLLDITERKRTDEKLRESEQQYRSVVEDSPLLICRFLPDGTITFVNYEYREYFGNKNDELIGKNIQSTVLEEDREKVFSDIALLSAESSILMSENKNLRRDGEFRWIRWTSRALFDDKEWITSYQAFGEDITERKRTENELRELEANYQSLFKNIPSGIYRSTSDGEILATNPALVRMLGYESEDELKNIHIHDLYVDPENREDILKTISKNGETFTREICLKRKDGQIISVLDNTRTIHDEHGKILYFEGTLTDITERKCAEQEIGTLLELSRQSGTETSLDDLLFSIAARIVEVIPPAEAASIHLYDTERQVLKIKAWAGFKDSEIKGIEFRIDGSLGGRILSTRKPALINNASEDPDYKRVNKPGIKTIKSQIAVPLIYKERVIGIIFADNRTRIGAFSQKDLDFLESIGNQLAGTIENARLFEQVREDQERLRQSEQQYRSVVEDSPLLICRFLPDGTITFVNQEYCKYFGKKYDELIGTNVQSTMPEENSENIVSDITLLSAGSPILASEKKSIKHDGEVRWVRWTNRALFDDKERITSYQAFGEDITERKRAQERELKQYQNVMFLAETAMSFVDFPPEEDIYRFVGEQLREHIGESIVIINSIDQAKGILTTRAVSGLGKLSKGAIKLIGRDPVGLEYDANDENLAYLSDGNLHDCEKGLYEVLLETVPKPVCHALEKLYPFNKMYTMGFVKNDVLFGTVVIFLSQGAELESKETVKSFVKQASIAIQRRQAEEALRQEQEKAQKYLDIAGVIMIALNQKGEVTLINQEGRRILGYEEDELIGKNWFDTCLPEKNVKEIKQVFKKIMVGGDDLVDHYENQVLTKSGEQKIIAWHNTNLWDEKGNCIGILSSGEDISKRERTQQLLNTLNQAGIAMGKALTHTDIFNAIADQLKQLDISCMLFPLDESKTRLYTRYCDYETTLLIKTEKLAGLEHKDLSFPVDTINAYREVIREKKNLFIDNSEQVVQQVLPEFAKGLSTQAIKILRVRKSILVPLIVEDQVLGVFSVQSDDLIQDDIPIVTAFADQLAGAWLKVEFVRKLKKSLDGTIRTIAATVEVRDSYTAGHQLCVSDLATAIANQMGLAESQVEGIRMAGIIHDLGKIRVPAEILSKPGKLSELEFELIKTHPQVGYDLLKNIEFPWPLAQIVLQHHERMDGSGYPQGLMWAEIMLEARILGVADVVEAMSTHRPYRPALGLEKALAQIRKDKGTLLDSEVVDACLKVFEQGYKLTEIEGMFKTS